MTVVIGFGNPLLGDDGVGAEVARRVAAARSDITVLTPHQLLPELAATLARATTVVFVDAATGGAPGTVQCDSLLVTGTASVGHVLTPAALVTLASQVFGREPPAWLVRVHGSRFDMGASLSAEVQRVLPTAVDAVLALVVPKLEVRS